MTEEQSKTVSESTTTPTEPVAHDPPKEDVAQEKSVIPQPSPFADDSKALLLVESMILPLLFS